MTELAQVIGADFAATATHDGTAITIVLTGNADNAAIEGLDRVLTSIHADATRLGVREAIVDLRLLEFMNSSCFKTFVTWISDVGELPTPQQYQIRFRSDPGMHWQKRSLHALRCFAIDLITVEA